MPDNINMSFTLLLFFCLFSASFAETSDCDNSDAPFLCHSTRVVRSVLDHVLSDSDTALNLVPGIDIVEVAKSANDTNTDTDTNRTADNSYLGRVSRYLQRHELKIKFPEIVRNVDDNNATLNVAVKSVSDGQDITGKLKVWFILYLSSYTSWYTVCICKLKYFY